MKWLLSKSQSIGDDSLESLLMQYDNRGYLPLHYAVTETHIYIDCFELFFPDHIQLLKDLFLQKSSNEREENIAACIMRSAPSSQRTKWLQWLLSRSKDLGDDYLLYLLSTTTGDFGYIPFPELRKSQPLDSISLLRKLRCGSTPLVVLVNLMWPQRSALSHSDHS